MGKAGQNLIGRKPPKRVDVVAAREIDEAFLSPEMLALTEKQQKFCELYVSRDDLTHSEMAEAAGYPKSRALVAKLLEIPQVVAYIKKLRAELNAKYEVTFENHVRKLAEIRDLAMQNGAYAAAVSAEKHRGQVASLYVDRKEILHGRLDQMSREDVMKEIAKLKEEFPGLNAILETNMVIEHQPAIETRSGQNDEEAGEQVQPEADEGNEG